jgi:hypothetical protein
MFSLLLTLASLSSAVSNEPRRKTRGSNYANVFIVPEIFASFNWTCEASRSLRNTETRSVFVRNRFVFITSTCINATHKYAHWSLSRQPTRNIHSSPQIAGALSRQKQTRKLNRTSRLRKICRWVGRRRLEIYRLGSMQSQLNGTRSLQNRVGKANKDIKVDIVAVGKEKRLDEDRMLASRLKVV